MTAYAFCYDGAIREPGLTRFILQRRAMNKIDRYWDCLDQAMEASHGGRTEEALAWLDEALVARPEGAEAHNGRGEILWDDARVDEALHEFERSIQADPKFPAAHLNRIELLVEDLCEFEQAVLLRVGERFPLDASYVYLFVHDKSPTGSLVCCSYQFVLQTSL